jgi:hypothetical protein
VHIESQRFERTSGFIAMALDHSGSTLGVPIVRPISGRTMSFSKHL